MPDDMIKCMNKLAQKQKMSLELIFADQNLNIFEDDKSDDYEHDANDGENEFNWSDDEDNNLYDDDDISDGDDDLVTNNVAMASNYQQVFLPMDSTHGNEEAGNIKREADETNEVL